MVSNPIDFRPESEVSLGDLLRSLPPILAGGKDPSDQLESLDLLFEIGTRLWQALLSDTAPPEKLPSKPASASYISCELIRPRRYEIRHLHK
jgi:hypothetical protein